MTAPTPARFDPDQLALLEEERDFLLRSLEDLERERTDGNLDADEYQRLRDDYTARAAAVLRTIRDGVDARPRAPQPPLRRRVAVGVGVVFFVVLAAGLLARTLGERLPGESVTGNDQLRDEPSGGGSATPAGAVDELAAAVAENPDDAALRRDYADALLDVGQAAEALAQYDAAVRLDPADAASRASAAMIVFNAGLVDDALARLDAAEAADPRFADTWFFRGIVLLRGRNDIEGSRTAIERYLDLAPDGLYAEDARVVLASLAAREQQSP